MTDLEPERATPDLTFRHPTTADHPRVVGNIDEWWGGRRVHDQLPRLWFEHFASTCWLAETRAMTDPRIDFGLLAGFLVGFRSPDRPEVAHIHLIGTNPNLRRRGIGRRLYEQFTAQVVPLGVRRLEALTWPGDRPSLAFHAALGFVLDDGPETTRLYGVPAYPDHDHPGEDRTRLVLGL